MYSTILQPGRALGYTVHTPAPALFTVESEDAALPESVTKH